MLLIHLFFLFCEVFFNLLIFLLVFSVNLLLEHLLSFQFLLLQLIKILFALSFEMSQIVLVRLLGGLEHLLELIHFPVQDQSDFLGSLPQCLVFTLQEYQVLLC